MRLKDVDQTEIQKKLLTDGLNFIVGGFSVRLKSNLASIFEGVSLLYGDSEVVNNDFVDFHVEIKAPSFLRNFIRPRVQFFLNGNAPFFPMSYDQAVPLLEWGLNWCVTNHFHEHLVIHAAVVEKNEQAIILPGTPGSGKSTLCAALVNSTGWRLLSDELAIFNFEKGVLVPNPRPVSLKNQSIDIIKQYSPDALFSKVVHHTIKGSVAHMKPSFGSVKQRLNFVKPAYVVFPKYQKEVNTGLTKTSKGNAFIELAEHSFNYQILQESGFLAVSQILNEVDCYKFLYNGNLDFAIDAMESLVNG